MSYETGYYLLGASSSASTLTMTDEEKAAALERERRRGTFGFGRILDQPPAPRDPTRPERALWPAR